MGLLGRLQRFLEKSNRNAEVRPEFVVARKK
jgi:hypothetical protein